LLVPRYKLSLCHTAIKPDLLGFPRIGVFTCGLRDHDVRIKCPNRRVMLTRDNGEVGFESEEMPPLVDCSDEEIAYPVKGEALVIRRALNMQIKEYDVDQQQENIFHT